MRMSILLLVSALMVGQATDDAISRKEVLRNDHVTAYQVEIPPGVSSSMHKHEKDLLSIAISGGELRVKGDNSSEDVKAAPGELNFREGPFTHSVENIGKSPIRVVDILFAAPQGRQVKPAHKKTHYCDENNKTACVTERYLFCTTKFCAEDVTMGPGAKSTRHSHDTDHMMVAVSDYTLSDDTTGKGTMERKVKSGGVEYLPAGITHVLTNTGPNEAHFIAIIFK